MAVHQLVEQQAVRTPDAIAVRFGDAEVSYRDLDARAEALAQNLRHQGAGRDVLVGLLAERSLEMVVGILAIFKAGAAYLPLNPSYPEERLSFIARDAGVNQILATPGSESLAQRLGAATVLSFTDTTEDAPKLPWSDVSPDDLAYVIYTSGSTGEPKGVSLAHGGLSALLEFTRGQMNIGRADRVLQFASFSFDASIWEIFAALISGATLVLGTRDELVPGPSLHALMRRHEITIALLSPSVLQILPPHGLDDLRIVVAGTEKLTGDIVSRWQRPGRRFFNAYGPTETTIYQTIWEAPEQGPFPDNPPIGLPTPGVEIYLLGEDHRPVKDGDSGELYIGGTCLGRGYLNRPELSREKFVSLPLGANGQHVRVYRSGDRAERLADGNLAYLGRMDLQVKVRGFRVELGEIETLLGQHPLISSTAVVADRDGAGLTRLWGYFVSRGSETPTAADLQAFLAQRLPDYMIPSGFTSLTHWPLNPNGKLNREALRQNGQNNPDAAEKALGMSSTQTSLLAFCQDVLDRPGLQIDAPLLENGMHSLALAHLMWRIQDAFGVAPSFSQMFARPTIASIAELVERLRAEKNNPAPGGIPIARQQGLLPLSFAQKRIWFLERLYPGNNAYRFQSVLRFHGRLNIPALESALNDILWRHEILRTTFPDCEGSPVQRIHTFEPFRLIVEEMSAEEATQRIASAVRQPFDLEVMPLVRWQLFRIAAEEYWLLHCEHHMLHDGWAYGVFLSELFAIYDARVMAKPMPLAPLPIQYADFAAWQNNEAAAGHWNDQLAYWQAKLREAPHPAQLPTQKPRPTQQTFSGAQFRIPLDAELYATLLAACAQRDVTPYMWLHTVFQTFLHRYTGQTDIVVGTGFANRKPRESHQMLGMVINTVALRVDFSGQPRFREALARVREAVLEAADNQDAPYEQVVHRLEARNALFNTFFDSFDRRYTSYRSNVLRVESEDGINNGTCKFDVVALVIPGKATPATLLWEYNTDLFSEELATQMVRHFLALLRASIANAELPVAALPLLSADDLQWLGEAENGHARNSVVRADRIEQIFAEIAAAGSDAPAIVCGEERLTYREVNRRAEELAAQLRDHGVKRGDVVAFCLPRGAQAICAMLAILKCGGAYLPLDPKLPPARVETLLRIARPAVLLKADQILRCDTAYSNVGPTPTDAAYIMFTSGSTGLPKAVCVPHQGVTRLVCGVDYVRLNPETRFLQLAPLSFDASTLEIWGPLLNGGVVVVHPDDLPAFADLGRTLVANKVTTAWLTAALFNQIVTNAAHILSPLRELLTGGEALSVPHVLRALAELPGTTIINGYGPTEATTFATTFTVPRDFDPASSRVPIGRPLPSTEIHVLNELGQRQPKGVTGEIFIGGDGVAQGYRGDDALTADRFVPDPFANRPDARLYRTGDRGRWLPDGTLDFVERSDRQVKIRGFRIEPGEIESVIAKHPMVREVHVAAVGAPAEDRRLVAYVVTQTANIAEALVTFLRKRLPDYLIPAQIVRLDGLPKTFNGKLDREALLGLGSINHRQNGATRTAARNSLEEVIVGIWTTVLERDQVGVDEDFFQIGGHSLLGLQLIHELCVAFGLDLPVRLLFEEPTVSGQAREIAKALAEQKIRQRAVLSSLVPLRPGGNKPPFFLVAGGFGGEAELLVYAKLARYFDSQRPFYGLRARGVDEIVEPHETVEKMATEYIREILAIQPHGPYFIAGACVGGVVALEIAQQLRTRGEAIGLLMLVDSSFPTRMGMWKVRLRDLWSNTALPFLRRCRAGRHEFRAAMRESYRLLFKPSHEQQIGLRRVQIGRKYLSHLLRYTPRAYPGQMTLIVCEKFNGDPGRVWRDLAEGGIAIHLVPGDHFTHLRDYVQFTAARIEACLQEA